MNVLKEVREDKGMTQVELSEKSGVCRPTIIKIEAGNESEVKISTILRLAAALDKEPRDIFCANCTL